MMMDGLSSSGINNNSSSDIDMIDLSLFGQFSSGDSGNLFLDQLSSYSASLDALSTTTFPDLASDFSSQPFLLPLAPITQPPQFIIDDIFINTFSTSENSNSEYPENQDGVRCPHCQSSFKGPKRRMHLINHCQSTCYKSSLSVSFSGPDSKQIQCPVAGCQKSVNSQNWKTNLADHLLTHDSLRTARFACLHPGCKKVFFPKNLAKDCARKHVGALFQCSTCRESFASRYAREKHRKLEHQKSPPSD
ncbi:hypothetical protein BDR26DRAFT_877516 [Obelidium mucronatum]|nr:hypothetical protein BDR26DRAFT_877516 [Obelidium mucronatum]